MKLPYEITPENLLKMEKFIRRKRYWAKKRRVIQILSAPVAQILFFWHFKSFFWDYDPI